MVRRRFIALGSRLALFLACPISGAKASIGTDHNRRPIAVHTVFFQFKDGIEQEKIEGMFAKVAALGKEVPGILDISFGRNFSPRARNYSHAVTMRFKDRTALEAFYNHPSHQKLISEWIKPIIEDLLPLDYEDAAPVA